MRKKCFTEEEKKRSRKEAQNRWCLKNRERLREYVRRRRSNESPEIKKCKAEKQRRYALDRYYKIKADPEKRAIMQAQVRDTHLKKKFGLSVEEYNAMLFDQGERCAICKKQETSKFKGTGRSFSVDHCHETGKIRGLLCHRCNTSLGGFGDSVELLLTAVSYLSGHGK